MNKSKQSTVPSHDYTSKELKLMISQWWFTFCYNLKII